MSKPKNKVQAVQSSAEYGIYVWQLPNGSNFQDDQGNTLNVPARKYDIQKMKQLADAAAYWGKPEGKAVFMPGVGRSSDTQAQEDIDRMAEGLTPYGDTDNWREVFHNARNAGN
jgi:hypothetical protein